MREFTEQELVRREKARELREKGIDPFVCRFNRSETALSIKEKYGTKILFLQAMPSPVKRIKKNFRYQILSRYVPDDKITCDFYNISDIIEKDVSIFVELNPNNLR